MRVEPGHFLACRVAQVAQTAVPLAGNGRTQGPSDTERSVTPTLKLEGDRTAREGGGVRQCPSR